MNSLRVRVSREEFARAVSGKEIFGILVRERAILVSVDLGREVDYCSRGSDDANTSYRQFFGCHLYIHSTVEERQEGIYDLDFEDVSVVIYA